MVTVVGKIIGTGDVEIDGVGVGHLKYELEVSEGRTEPKFLGAAGRVWGKPTLLHHILLAGGCQLTRDETGEVMRLIVKSSWTDKGVGTAEAIVSGAPGRFERTE